MASLVLLASQGVGHQRDPRAGKLAAKVTHRDGSGADPDPLHAYTNPLKSIGSYQGGRIDMGYDFAGAGPILALGSGTVTEASNHDAGAPSCYGRTCWPGGGIVVYQLANGPFAGKYVYVAESITVTVRAGQSVTAGQQIAIAHRAYPDVETGWASGKGPETLAIADRHECQCGDPGGWSTIEGRNFNQLLLLLGAPSGTLQPNLPKQAMPAGWPSLPSSGGQTATPRSLRRLSEGPTGG